MADPRTNRAKGAQLERVMHKRAGPLKPRACPAARGPYRAAPTAPAPHEYEATGRRLTSLLMDARLLYAAVTITRGNVYAAVTITRCAYFTVVTVAGVHPRAETPTQLRGRTDDASAPHVQRLGVGESSPASGKEGDPRMGVPGFIIDRLTLFVSRVLDRVLSTEENAWR
jgi:hypothetical protein